MKNLLNARTILMCPQGGTVSAISSDTLAIAPGGSLVRPSVLETVRTLFHAQSMLMRKYGARR